MTRGLVVCAGLALLLCSASAAAVQQADVAGAWKMTYTTKDGVKMESTLTLKNEGGVLSGSIDSPRGTVALNEVTVKGEEIAFAVIRVGFGDTIRIDYKGTVKGDTMTLKMTAGAREPLDVTAKRGG
jgi:hypothetical protein